MKSSIQNQKILDRLRKLSAENHFIIIRHVFHFWTTQDIELTEEEKIEALNFLYNADVNLGISDEATSILKNLIQLFKKKGNEKELIKLKILEIQQMKDVKNYIVARSALTALLADLEKLNESYLKAVICVELADLEIEDRKRGDKTLTQAEKYAINALYIYRGLKDEFGIATTNSHLGRIYFNRGEYNKAQEQFNIALETFKNLNKYRDAARQLHNLGCIFHHLFKWDSALDYFKEALSYFTKIDASEDIARTTQVIADLFIINKKWEQAARHQREVVRNYEKLRMHLPVDNLNPLAFFSETYEAYQNLLDVEYELYIGGELHLLDDMFQLSEILKHRSFLEELLKNKVNWTYKPSDMKSTDAESLYQNLLQEIAQYVIYEQDDEIYHFKKNECLEKIAKIKYNLVFQFNSTSMNVFLISENSNIIELKKVHDLFTEKDQMIISYVCTNYYVYRWEFTPNTHTPKFQRLGKIEDIRADFDVAYDKDGLLNCSFFTKEKCALLFNFLFSDIDIGFLSSKRLLISPHERFEEVPFFYIGAICDNAFQNTVLYSIPSLNLAYYLQKKRTQYAAFSKKAICFGGAFFEIGDCKKADPPIPVKVLIDLINFPIPYTSISDKRLKLYLPGTLKEICAIKNLLNLHNEDVKSGIDASISGFLNTDFTDYRILHVATHGIRAEEKMNVPVLLMSMVGRKNQSPDNGLLWYSDIANKNIPVECAVLSSCHSASGHYLRGEGSYTIAKAFFIAGVKSVLSTFWSLNDTDSATFMEKFYSILLEKNYDYAYSLMLAQQRSKQDSLEKIWGNFCFIGVWN